MDLNREGEVDVEVRRFEDTEDGELPRVESVEIFIDGERLGQFDRSDDLHMVRESVVDELQEEFNELLVEYLEDGGDVSAAELAIVNSIVEKSVSNLASEVEE